MDPSGRFNCVRSAVISRVCRKSYLKMMLCASKNEATVHERCETEVIENYKCNLDTLQIIIDQAKSKETK